MYPPTKPGVTSRHRLRGHDYAQPGYYFITICINDRSQRLGIVTDEVFHPNDAGRMVERVWLDAPQRFPGATLDAWCLMPNHFHGVIGLGVMDSDRPPYPSIVSIMDWFKSVTTVEYIRGVKSFGWPRYHKRLWLDGYNDRVIRNESELYRIREYIEANPSNWVRDEFHLR